jgi:hypothetical protein
MSEQEFEKYLTSRYSSALQFYDRRACQNKWGYRALSVYIIIASAALAALGTINEPPQRVLVAVLSPTIAIAMGVISLFQLQQNWLSYRATWDALKREPHLRTARLSDYSTTTDPNALFVHRVEALLSKEGAEWLNRQSRDEGQQQKKA